MEKQVNRNNSNHYNLITTNTVLWQQFLELYPFGTYRRTVRKRTPHIPEGWPKQHQCDTFAYFKYDRQKSVNGNRMEDGAYYTLNGVKVENPSKGLYIKNGKKVII